MSFTVERLRQMAVRASATVRNAEEREDALQEAWIKGWELTEADPGASESLVGTAMMNAVVDHARRRSAQDGRGALGTRPGETSLTYAALAVHSDARAEERIVSKMEAERCLSIMDHPDFPVRNSAAIFALREDGYETPEISDRLGIAPNAIKCAVYRARHAMALEAA